MSLWISNILILTIWSFIFSYHFHFLWLKKISIFQHLLWTKMKCSNWKEFRIYIKFSIWLKGMVGGSSICLGLVVNSLGLDEPTYKILITYLMPYYALNLKKSLRWVGGWWVDNTANVVFCFGRRLEVSLAKLNN